MLTFYLGSFLEFYFTDKQLLNYSHLRVDLPLPLKVKALHWSISICGNYLLKSLWWLCFFVDCDMIGSRLYSFSRWPPWNLYWFDFKLVRYIKKESTLLTFFRSNRNYFFLRSNMYLDWRQQYSCGTWSHSSIVMYLKD